jgi:hypothetical protein
MLMAVGKVEEGIGLLQIGEKLWNTRCCFVLECYYLEIAGRELIL